MGVRMLLSSISGIKILVWDVMESWRMLFSNSCDRSHAFGRILSCIWIETDCPMAARHILTSAMAACRNEWLPQYSHSICHSGARAQHSAFRQGGAIMAQIRDFEPSCLQGLRCAERQTTKLCGGPHRPCNNLADLVRRREGHREP
jgi:hypothetical protein